LYGGGFCEGFVDGVAGSQETTRCLIRPNGTNIGSIDSIILIYAKAAAQVITGLGFRLIKYE
jgi:hypothetical protein